MFASELRRGSLVYARLLRLGKIIDFGLIRREGGAHLRPAHTTPSNIHCPSECLVAGRVGAFTVYCGEF